MKNHIFIMIQKRNLIDKEIILIIREAKQIKECVVKEKKNNCLMLKNK